MNEITSGQPEQDSVLVTVEATQGSAPREAGAWMLVTPGGTANTIGGGQLEFQAIDEARSRLNDRHTKPREAFDAVIRRDGSDDRFHMIVDALRDDLGIDGNDTERPAAAHLMGTARGRDQRLRGHATVIQAIAAHLMLLDQHDLEAELRRGRRE